MGYTIYFSREFEKTYSKLDASEKQWIHKTFTQLEFSPLGKPLHFAWFREKKYLDKRLYSLVDEHLQMIFIIDFSSKKEQQKIISFVLENMSKLLLYLK